MNMIEIKKLLLGSFTKSNEEINNRINHPISTKSESALPKDLSKFETKLLSRPPKSLCRIRRFGFKNDCVKCTRMNEDLEEKNLSRGNNNLESYHHHNHRKKYVKCLIVILFLIIIFIIIYLPIHLHKIKNASQSDLSKQTNFPNSCSTSISNQLSNFSFNVPIKEVFTPEEYRNSWTVTTPQENSSPLEYEIIEPINPQGKGKGWTIIFLHGLGDLNATQSYEFKDYLNSDLSSNPFTHQEIGQLTGFRYVMPKAPFRPITVFDDEIHRGWFDIKDWRDLNFLEDEDGLRDSSIKISKIIKDLIDEGKINMDFTILAGFSQGAVMSFLLTLVLPQPPFAALIMSGYPPLPFRWPLLTSTNQNLYKKTSLYFTHGVIDQVLNYNKSKFGFKLFQSVFNQKFKQVKFKTFPNLSHSFSFEELVVVANWIQGIVEGQSGGVFDQRFDEYLVPENNSDDFIG